MLLFDKLVDALAATATLLIAAVILMITADVGGRFLFNEPLPWVFEATQHAMVLILFFGMPYVARERGHVSVDLIEQFLPPAAMRVCALVTALVVAGLCAVVAFYAAQVSIDSYHRGVLTTGMYGISRAVLTAPIAVGFLLTAIQYVRDVVNIARGHRHTAKQPSTQTSA